MTAKTGKQTGCSPWAILGCGCGSVAILGIVFIFLSITISFGLARRNPQFDREAYSTCRNRLVSLGMALEHYSAEHDGHYPPTLDVLYPQYLTESNIAHCPREHAAQATVYEYHPPTGNNLQATIIGCSNHGQGRLLLLLDGKHGKLRVQAWPKKKTINLAQ